MSILTAPRPTVQTDAALDAEVRTRVASVRAEARAAVSQLLADLEDVALVDDVKGYLEYLAACAAAGVRP